MRQILQSLIKQSFLIIFILSFSYPAVAGPLKRPLSFHQVTPKEGLSSEMVIAIAVQREEVWFGTYGGGATLYDRSKKVCKAYTTRVNHGLLTMEKHQLEKPPLL
jgi:hypothetical protein